MVRCALATAFTTLIASSAHGATVYYDFASWSAAVGSYQVEDFESYQAMGFPLEGGQIPLDHFILEADANGDDKWGPGGITDGNHSGFYSGPELGLGFLTTLEILCGDDESCGPTYERAIFPQPVIGLFLDVPWTEDGWLGFSAPGESVHGLPDGVDSPNHGLVVGAVFDEPVTVVYFDAEHSWAFIDTLYWATVPEPGTAALLSLGLLALATRRTGR